MCLKSSIFTTCWKTSLGCCPIAASFMWRLSGSCKDISCHSKSCCHDGRFGALHIRARISLFVSICWAGKGFSEGTSFAVHHIQWQHAVWRAVLTSAGPRLLLFFFSKIRSVSPEPFPKNKHKTFGSHKPQWWVIVPKWKDEHSKTTGILYLLFTHHNGTILEQLSGRVNERKETKNKQNKFTAFSQQANLKVNSSRQNETSVIVYSTSYLSKCISLWVLCWIQSRTFEKYLTLNVWSRLLLFSCFYLFLFYIFVLYFICIHNILFKGMVQPKIKCSHHLLTLMSFQTCLSFFLMLNTK